MEHSPDARAAMASPRCRVMRRMLGLSRVSQSVTAASSASVMSSGIGRADGPRGAQHEVHPLRLDDHAAAARGGRPARPTSRGRWRRAPGRTRSGAATSSRGSPAARRASASRSMVRAIGVQLLRPRRSRAGRWARVRPAAWYAGDPEAIAGDHVRLDGPGADVGERGGVVGERRDPHVDTLRPRPATWRTPGSQWSGEVSSRS